MVAHKCQPFARYSHSGLEIVLNQLLYRPPNTYSLVI
ncbi:protein of unknown function [Pseudomonas sp. JV551A1]|nr:protein of unknown function [Pseudomonas sp. JV551A1]